MKIYLAGPLFTQAEQIWNEQLATQLSSFGYDVFLPQEDSPQHGTPTDIFETGRDGVLDADVVVAIMDGADPDSGTCWECGFAHGQGIRVVVVRTDFRGTGDAYGRYNLILSESAWRSVELFNDPSVEDLAFQIHIELSEG